MKKKPLILCIILAVFAAFVLFACGDDEVVDPGELEFKEVTKSGELVGYSVAGIGTYKSSDVVIPEKYKGLPVTRIEAEAFKVELPTEFDAPDEYTPDFIEDMFEWYNNQTFITSVTMPDSIVNIAEGAFEGCALLKSVSLPSKLTYIGGYAFRNCTSLREIVIPDTVATIARNAFANSGLRRVTLGESVSNIGDYAFGGCEKLIEVENRSALNISRGTEHGGNVAKYAQNVYGQKGKSKITRSGDFVFYADDDRNEYDLIGYDGGAADITLPNDFEGKQYDIYKYAFSGNVGLKSIKLTDAITFIGDCAFLSCMSLNKIDISDTVMVMGENVFAGCYSLETLTLPASVNVLGEQLFTSGRPMNVYYDGTLGDWCRISRSGSRGTSAGRLYNLYIDEQLLTRVDVPEFVTEIKPQAFKNCVSISSVYIPDTVTAIGEEAFAYCINVINVTIGENVADIGSEAFYSCFKLVEICDLSDLDIAHNYINGQFGDIGRYARNIYGTDGESRITDKGGYKFFTDYVTPPVDSIAPTPPSGELAPPQVDTDTDMRVQADTDTDTEPPEEVTYLMGLPGGLTVEQLKLPNTLGFYSIYPYAFAYYYNAKSVEIPDCVTDIGMGAFGCCYDLTGLSIGDKVEDIGRSAFICCSGLSEITVAKTNEKYSSKDNCVIETESKTLVLGCATSVIPSDGSVTSIGTGAFEYCSRLTAITLPSTLTKIESNAFYGCRRLAEVNIPNSVADIGWRAFYDCVKLSGVTLPNSVKSIGDLAFNSVKSIRYIGTMEQWRAIEKGYDLQNQKCVIRCIDGMFDAVE